MQKGVVRKRGTKTQSEYGRQLAEKQSLRKQYNLREQQFKRYVKETLGEGQKGGDAVERFLQRLEKRLDNVVYRAGIGQTRAQARQMASHGHFQVNGRTVTIPSYQVKKGDVISLHPSSADSPLFQNVKIAIKKFEEPSWLALDKESLTIRIQGAPSLEEIAPTVEIPLIFEYYSR